MNKFLLVFQHELKTILNRRSFLLTLFLVPLVAFIVITLVTRLGGGAPTESVVEDLLTAPEERTIMGFVDHSGLVEEVPADLQETLLPYDSVEAAEHALSAGVIAAYFRIPADYLQIGMVEKFGGSNNFMEQVSNSTEIETLLAYNLTGGDAYLVERLQTPMLVQREVEQEGPDVMRNPFTGASYYLPYAMTMLFYMLIFGNASSLLRSVTSEKENRVLEGLLTSLRPVELIAGKIAAVGLAGLLQTGFWLASAGVLLRVSGQSFGLSAADLPLRTLLWGLVYFLLGYGIYASLMAGVGALVPNIKESSQFSLLVSSPLILCLVFFNFIITAPDSTFSIVLSLFPLTAPVIMMTRLTAGTVPGWQLWLAAVLMAAMVVWIVASVSRLFHAQAMLAGSPVKIKRFLKVFVGKS
ncbi:MAG: ABC transporter permease [Anaerolineaceae bacterium]|jgi:ABC-2 type transport system permease protein|nr:ABC transporter permease [Anaerolineaceae bacterium]